jgi:HK97 family phage portal protein
MSNLNFIRKVEAPHQSAAPSEQRAVVLTDDGGAFQYDSSIYSGYTSGKTNDYKTKPAQIKANLGWVYAANNFIAEAFAGVEWQLKRTLKNGDKETITEHPLLTLLDSPVDNMHGMQFGYLHASYLNLVGESYIVPVGKNSKNPKLPAALHILPAHMVEYKQNKETGDEAIKIGKDLYLENTLEQRTFYRDYRPDPEYPSLGKSIVSAAASAIDTDEKAKRYNRQFFANAARPSMLVESQKQMTDLAYNRWKQQLNELYTGEFNAYKPLLLEGGAQAKPFALTQKDMDFLQGRKFSMDEILAMFGISPAMLGMIVAANRANMEAAEYNFAKWVLLPRVKAFAKFVNKYIIDEFDPSLELSFENFVPDDIAAKTTERKEAAGIWQTVNEIRKEMGLPDVTGGDDLYRKSGYTKLGEEPAAPPAATPPAATPPNPDDEPAAADSDADKDTELRKKRRALALKIRRNRDAKKKIEQRNAQLAQARLDQGERRIATALPLLEKYETDFMQATRVYFEGQRKDVLAEMTEALPDGERKYSKRAIDPVYKQLQLIVSDQQYDIDLSNVLKPLYEGLMTKQLVDTFAQLGDFTPPADVPSIAEFARNRAGRIAKDINDETQKQIMLSIAEGIDKGESRNQLRVRVETVFGDAASYRAERIARTESVNAAGQADLMGWRDSSIVVGKQWHTAIGDACPFCTSLNGKILELDTAFVEMGETQNVQTVGEDGKVVNHSRTEKYEAKQCPPAHPNCRCTMLPILKDF